MVTRFLLVVAVVAVVATSACRKADATSGPCPEGSRQIGAEPPEGSQRSCVLTSNAAIKHGPLTEWWPGAMPPRKKREGAFAHGKLTGKWTAWYESGRLQREVTYVDGLLEGKHLERHDNATSSTKETGEYRGGLRVGVWQLFHENGVKERDLEHMPNGEQRWTVFSTAGAKVMSGVFVEGTKHGLFTEFYPSGGKASEGLWKSSKKDGKWTYWTADGAEVATEEYVDGKAVKSTGVVPARALPIGIDTAPPAVSATP